MDNQYIINPLSLHAILNFSFFFVTFRFGKNSFRFVSFRFVWFGFVSISFRTLQVLQIFKVATNIVFRFCFYYTCMSCSFRLHINDSNIIMESIEINIKRLLLYISSKNIPSNCICVVIYNKHIHLLLNPYVPHYTTVMSLMNKPWCRQFTDCLYNEVSKEMSL